MKQLIVLVGLPGSGKTTHQREHPEWVIVSRAPIRQSMFRCSFDIACEETVDRIFHVALVEALESAADVVCVDEPNLSSGERTPLVELARLAGREPVAHVMASLPVDVAYERVQRNLRRLALEKPHVRIHPFPRKVYELVASRYEPVTAEEGFTRVETIGAPESSSLFVPSRFGSATRSRSEREPLPLFSS